jgi:hypothetical protein
VSEQEFQLRLAEAEGLHPRRRGYAEGYMRGLRRFYHGPQSGTLQEHETWLGLAYDRYISRAERGRGYLDGLQGIRPQR